MKTPRFLPAGLACIALAAAAIASTTKSNVGTLVKEIDVRFIKNKPEQTIGKPMVLEFWATWCGPCRESIPHLNDIYAKYKDKGLVVIGITEEGDDVVDAFMKKIPMNYPVAEDKKGKFAEPFGIKGIPHTMLVDKAGKIVWEGHPLELEEKDIEKLL